MALREQHLPSLVVGEAPARAARRGARRLLLWSRLSGDVGALLVGLVVAGRLQETLVRAELVHPLGATGVFNAVAVTAWLLLFAGLGLYDSRRLVSAVDEFKLLVEGVALGTVGGVFLAFLLKLPTYRSWVLTTWIGCTAAVLGTRFAYRSILRALRFSGALGSRMLIVGAGREGRDLYRSISSAPHLGFEVVGFLDDTYPPGPAAPGLPDVLGGAAEVRAAVLDRQADAVLVAGGSVATETAERVYRDLGGMDVDLHLSTGLLGVAASRVAVQRFGEAPVLGLRRVELTGFQQTVKRAFDLAVAGLLLVALAPVLAACALAVRLDGPGPVLFRQRRVGRGGREFTMHKFRSMVPDAERRLAALVGRNQADGPLFKLRGDPRVTRVGRVLRAWSLDELPQLLDVLRGDMSLVGPRPPLLGEAARFGAWLPNRLRVKPGVSGLWQVSGRHQLSFEDYVRYDLFYVENWSLVMDLCILLRTIPTVLRRSGI
ncbi:MAG TPA: sugar transferase [Actinomycetota bacterium]|nr:sugar transferase [Actinomycetota bacterium]